MSFSSSAVRAVAVPVLLLLLILAIALSLLVGAKPLPASVIVDALSGTCQSAECIIVLDARLPRTLAGLLAGGALGLAGALMQTLTRNPLADHGILGVNSGASFAIVLGAALFGFTSPSEQLVMAFCGALAASLVVAFTGSRGGGQLSPVRLTLAGVALAAVLEGLSNGIALLNPDVYDQLRFWQAGSLDIRTLDTLKVVAFPVFISAAVALCLSRALNSLSLGSDTATALGNRVARTQLTGLLVITVLCGSATAVVGPIAFIGLMMPHMARWLVGADHRWSLPVTLLATPALLLFADVLGRLLVPGELRVSVVSAFIGAPVLIFWYDADAGWRMMAPSRRLLTSVALLVVASLLLAVWSLQSGAVTLDFAQVFHALTGSAPRNITMVVTEWRLPRVAMAIWLAQRLASAAQYSSR